MVSNLRHGQAKNVACTGMLLPALEKALSLLLWSLTIFLLIAHFWLCLSSMSLVAFAVSIRERWISL